MKTNTGHEYRLCLHQFSRILLAELLIQIVFILNFTFSAVISENFFPCTIFCSTVSLQLLFSKCSDFLFLKDILYCVTYITKVLLSSLHLKSIGVYFQTEDIKRTITTNRSTTSSLWRNMQWQDCLRFWLSMFYQNWNKVVGCGLHLSSCILYDNVLWIYSLLFSFFSINPNRKL